jgi:hypothetical protein
VTQEHTAPVPGKFDPSTFPDAWYAISARVDNAHAVVSCIQEALPHLNGMSGDQCRDINKACFLIAAAEDLLDLCKRDVELLEAELKGIALDPCSGS